MTWRPRIDVGDQVLLTEDAFECLEECSHLSGVLGEVVYVASALEDSELTIFFKKENMLLQDIPQTFVVHVATC